MANVTQNEMLHNAEGKFGIYSVAKNGAHTVLRLRSKAPKKQSERQSEYRALFSSLARTFKHGTSTAQKNGWKTLGRMMPPTKLNAARPYLTAYGAFMSVNLTLNALNANNPVVVDAPAFDWAKKLPDLTLNATLNDNQEFTLTLGAGAEMLFPALLASVPAALIGQTYVNDQFTLLETLGTLPAPPAVLDLTEAFLTQHSLPELDSQITLLATPITMSGFRGEAKQIKTVVTIPAAQATTPASKAA